MVKHANAKMQEILERERQFIDAFGGKGWAALHFPGQYELYVPSFLGEFSPRISESNKRRRWIGVGDFDIKGLAFTDVPNSQPLGSPDLGYDEDLPLDSPDILD